MANSVNVNFSENLFNPLFWKLRKTHTRFCVSYGGAGSSKSYTQAQHEFIKSLEGKEKILILRKVGVTLKDSVIPLMNHIIDECGMRELWNENKSDREITNKVNGSKFIFRGMDDPEKIKSIQGITRIWIEEASEFELSDLQQLNIRIRGAENLQISLTFNPIDEQHWLKSYFFDSDDQDATIHHTTYKDNRFIDNAYIKEIERYKKTDYNFYKVYALGEWGKLDKGGEFYKKFKPEVHTGPATYQALLPLHISFDENVNPYVTCTVWQIKDKKAWQIDEICLISPKNTLKDTCKEFSNRYSFHKSGVFVYGDATSKKDDVKLEKGHNFFTLVEKNLMSFRPSMRIAKSNPSVPMRGNFINAIFESNEADIEIIIDESCSNTIADYNYLKEAPDGRKLKEKAKDSRTKVVYEKYGHCSDANDYLICQVFKQEYSSYIKGGKKFKYKSVPVTVNPDYTI